MGYNEKILSYGEIEVKIRMYNNHNLCCHIAKKSKIDLLATFAEKKEIIDYLCIDDQKDYLKYINCMFRMLNTYINFKINITDILRDNYDIYIFINKKQIQNAVINKYDILLKEDNSQIKSYVEQISDDINLNIDALVFALESAVDTIILHQIYNKILLDKNNKVSEWTTYGSKPNNCREVSKICKICGLNYGKIFCNNKKQLHNTNNLNECKFCKEQLRQIFIKDDDKLVFDSNHEIIRKYNKGNKCKECRNTGKDGTSMIKVGEIKVNKIIGLISKYFTNLFNQLIIILFLGSIPLIIDVDAAKLSFFLDSNEFFAVLFPAELWLKLYNLSIVLISFIISFILIAREDKEYEFISIKDRLRELKKTEENKVDYQQGFNGELIRNNPLNEIFKLENSDFTIKQFNMFENTIFPCLNITYDNRFINIAHIHCKTLLELKEETVADLKDTEIEQYNFAMQLKKKLNNDFFLVLVFSIYVFLAIPSIVYTSMLIDSNKYIFYLLYFIFKIRNFFKLIRMITILQKTYSCCCWYSAKMIKEREDDSKILANEDEIINE